MMKLVLKIGFVIVLFIPILLIRNNLENRIKNCHNLTIGIIYKISYGRVGDGLEFEYRVKGQILKDIYGGSHLKSFIGHKFPVIYSCKDSTYCHMLIYPDDFNEYGYKFPDSLKWVLTLKK